MDDAPQSAASSVYLLGGGRIDVRQGPVAVAKRLEGSGLESDGCVVLADPAGSKVFINPRAVAYVGRAARNAPLESADEDARAPGSRIVFSDGTILDVVQAPGVVNQRLDEARGSSSLLAPCATVGAHPAWINRAAVAAVTPWSASDSD